MSEQPAGINPDALAQEYRVQHGDLQALVEKSDDMTPQEFWNLAGRKLSQIFISNPAAALTQLGIIAEYMAIKRTAAAQEKPSEPKS